MPWTDPQPETHKLAPEMLDDAGQTIVAAGTSLQ
jgi:hypothetical protein